MRFNDPDLQAALEAWRLIPDVRERANADNFAFDERPSLTRQAAYEGAVGPVSEPEAFRRAHIDYVHDFMEIAGGIPHTFDPALGPARLSEIGVDPYLKIVRLESLTRPLSYWRTKPDVVALEALRQAHASGDTATMDEFLGVWNESNVRDHRPAFAAWKHQLDNELGSDDWANLLRDRLGLEHYDGSAEAIPVALMEYRVMDVATAATDARIADPITAPIVLDIRPGPYFFPSPGELAYGRAMSLVPIMNDDDLLAEMLHVRLPYRREHVMRLGVINRAPVVHDLRMLRNNHLHAVRVAAVREDFGEEIP